MAVLADKDIDQTMAADWAAIMEKHAVEPEEIDPVAAEPEAPTQDSVVTTERVRNEDGTFAETPKESVAKEPVPRKDVAPKPLKGAPKEAVAPAPEEPVPDAARDINRAPAPGADRSSRMGKTPASREGRDTSARIGLPQWPVPTDAGCEVRQKASVISSRPIAC